jgi:hypothetical protein
VTFGFCWGIEIGLLLGAWASQSEPAPTGVFVVLGIFAAVLAAAEAYFAGRRSR